MKTVRIVRRIYSVLSAPERKQASALLVMMLVTSLIELTGFLSIVPLVAIAADPSQVEARPWLQGLYTWTGAGSFRTFFLLLAGGFILLFAAAQAAHGVTGWSSDRLSYRVRHRLTVLLLARYLSKPYVWFLRRNSSDLTKAILRDVDRLVNEGLMVVLSMLRRSITTAGIGLVLVWLEPFLSLTALLFFSLLYGLVYGIFRRQVSELGEVHHEVNNLRYKAVQEGLASIQEGRMFFRRHHIVKTYRDHSWRSSLMLARYHLLQEIPNRVGHLLGVSSIIAALAYFASTAAPAALPMVGVFVLGVWRVAPELQRLYQDATRMSFEQPVLDSLYDDLSEPLSQVSPPRPEQRFGLTESIELRSVGFSYPGASVRAMEKVSVTIPRGSTIGIVGATGAGKTTLADLVGGFLTPQEGEILVDGVSIEDRPGWQRAIGYVPQSVYLSDDTVRRNIALGLPDELIDEGAVVQASQLAGIHDFIADDLAGGYGAVLGERGVCLSGGQCQRIGIARALYHDPDLLILDEATSSLDNLTERSVMTAIRGLARSKTLLLIAHRLSTVRDCDEILFCAEGRLEARGTYEELLEQCPAFRALALP